MDLSPAQIQQAAAVLAEARRTRTPLERLPGSLTPLSRGEGHAIAARVATLAGSPVHGWKIAATSAAGQAHLDVDAPIAGRMLADGIIPDGGTLQSGPRVMPLAEVECAFTLARDLVPRDDPYSQPEVRAALASVHPAIELPDTRLSRFTDVGIAELTADSACAAEFVLGPAAPPARLDDDLTELEVTITVTLADGTSAHSTGRGGNVLDGPLGSLTWLVGELSTHGITLHAGQVVTTGVLSAPIPLVPGTRVHADFGSLGTVSLNTA